jgi:Holliday junction DNA helicase RuvB
MSDPYRLQSLDEVVGQDRAKRLMRVLCQAARKRGGPMVHAIMVGSAGLGKTTFARLAAAECGVPICETIGSNLQSPEQLASILLGLQPRQILFIDEIHRIPPAVEEQLYPAIEDFKVATVTGGGGSGLMRSLGITQPTARAAMVDVAPFTLLGASTLSGMISAPLRSRCQIVQLVPYEVGELRQIISNAARRMGFPIGDDAAMEVARRSRSAARNAVQSLRWLFEYCSAEGTEPTMAVVEAAFDLKQVDRHGLTALDHQILAILRSSRGPVGLSTIAVRVGESEDTLERVVEPYLLQQGYLDKTHKGRVLGPAAHDVAGEAA